MDYSLIGFPRIGIHRELKFATESYFRGEINDDELKRVGSHQRMEQWTRQRDAGADFKAFRLCHAKVRPETQIHTHMCYSELEDIIPEIDAMDADVITFEASRSKLTILDSLMKHHFETEIGPGVYNIHSPRVPSIKEIETSIRLMLDKIPKEHLWINPDCGLKTRGETETIASLKNMVQAVKNIRTECKGDI